MAEKITIKATVSASVDKVWEYYNTPEHVMKWNNASDDWHTTSASNEFEIGGSFTYRMEAKDGSTGFDLDGTYDEIVGNQRIAYTLGDSREVEISFKGNEESTHIEVTFDAETENPIELQREGWQAILDNFKQYTEEN